MTDAAEAAEAGVPTVRGDDDRSGWAMLIKVATGVLAPTTLLTGLGLYFRFVSTDAFYEYFGVDASTLQFSTQDYLLRSVGALYVPVGLVVLLSLLIIFAAPSVFPRLGRLPARRRRRIGLGALVVAVVLIMVGVFGIVRPVRAGENTLLSPLAIVAGVLLLYGLHRASRARRGSARASARAATAGLVAALAVLGIFWAANTYAQRWGRGQALTLAGHLTLRPAVVLDTRESLFLQQPGVQETALPLWTKDQQFHYRYRGLRLLAQSGDRMFLIPAGWAPGDGDVLMITAGDAIRIQFAPG